MSYNVKAYTYTYVHMYDQRIPTMQYQITKNKNCHAPIINTKIIIKLYIYFNWSKCALITSYTYIGIYVSDWLSGHTLTNYSAQITYGYTLTAHLMDIKIN